MKIGDYWRSKFRVENYSHWFCIGTGSPLVWSLDIQSSNGRSLTEQPCKLNFCANLFGCVWTRSVHSMRMTFETFKCAKPYLTEPATF